MKRIAFLKTLLLAAGLSVGANAWAQTAPTEGAPLANGEYYLYNVGADRYLNRGATYTAHTVVDGQGLVATLTKNDTDDTYKISVIDGKWFNGDYTDGNDIVWWTFESKTLSDYTNVYALKKSDGNYTYWAGVYDTEGAFANEIRCNKTAVEEGKESAFYWILIPKSTRQNLASASSSNPLDITYLVANPDFEYQVRNNPWPGEGEGNAWNPDTGGTTYGWNTGGFWRQYSHQASAKSIFFEKYDGNGLTTADKIYQNVSLKAGTYRLTCTGHASYTEFYLYANNNETRISDDGTYSIDFEVKTDGSVEIGARIKTGGTGIWCYFDNVRLYCTGLYTIEQIIDANKGDLTSFVNGDFQSNANGWTGGSHITWVTARGWRGDNATKFYETSTTGSMSYTIADMPVGTYKVVAAARGYDGGKITPEIAGTTGTTLNTIGDVRNENSVSEINTNGVEMPYSDLGGFTADANGHNWRWISATGTLSTSGDLVIKFNCEGNQWMCIDDVHLYCTELGGTSYTYTVDDTHTSAGDNVVTADIILSNPNTIINSNDNIKTAAGVNLNNNLLPKTGNYNQSHIDNLVLYDGYNFTDPNAKFIWAGTLYRAIHANTWSTLVVPFWPKSIEDLDGESMKYPTSLENGVLSFSDVERESWNCSQPMLVKTPSEITAITGRRASDGCVNQGNMTFGSGAPMTGVYTNGNVPQSTDDTKYYVVGSDNNLHKVTGSGVTIAPFRAYFSLTGSTGEARSVIALDFGDETTAVEAVEIGQQAKDNAVYNLNGQRVNELRKGLYIVNGKKVFIK